MNPLHIVPNIYSPTVDFKEGNLLIEGESFPEDAPTFYQPVLDWLKQYANSIYTKDKKKQTIFTARLSYCNSASRPYMLKIVQILNNIHKEGHLINIIWYYDPNDELDDDDINFKVLMENFEAGISYVKW